jgi:hypothetical protein
MAGGECRSLLCAITLSCQPHAPGDQGIVPLLINLFVPASLELSED